MENEHFSVSRVTNWYMIIIVNSRGRSLIKFCYREAQPWGPTAYLLRLSFLQKRYSFRIPFHSSLMVEGSSGLLQAFYPQGVLKKVLYREALPRGPCPYLSTYHFCRKNTPFVYHSIRFGGCGVGWLVTGILKWSQTIQGSMGRKTALSKSNLRAILQFLFLVTKSY